jgi:hypothetical protein
MHDRIVVAEEVTKNLCFSLSVRGRREGREADVFEDMKGDGHGALKEKHRKMPDELDPVGITPADSIAHSRRCGYIWAAWGMIQREDQKEWARRVEKMWYGRPVFFADGPWSDGCVPGPGLFLFPPSTLNTLLAITTAMAVMSSTLMRALARSYANLSNSPARKRYVSPLSNHCLSHALAQQVGQFPCSIALL